MRSKHPRDQFITIYGRKPVLEALSDTNLSIDKIAIDHKARGPIIQEIQQLAQQRQITCHRYPTNKINRLSRNEKQDQGVIADIITTQMDSLDAFLEYDLFSLFKKQKRLHLLAFDGVTTPANIGLMIRSATGLGMDGLIYPRKGSPKISPLIVKASAGTLFRSRILKCEKITQGLQAAKAKGFQIYGLAGSAPQSLYQAQFAPKSIFLMGGETHGISSQAHQLVDHFLSIPMYQNVESLNVACAATLVCGEIARRRL